MRHPFRRKTLGPRLLPLYALGAAALWLAEPTPRWLAAGGLLAAAGAGLRAWGAGHLVKTERFVVSGPYARMRHPLYAGTLLAALGLGAAAGPRGAALALGVFGPFFFLYYLPYKDRIEGARLERRYGDAYTRWRRSVPALWPRRARFRGAAAAPARWSATRFRANDEAGALVAIVAAWLGLALRGLGAS
ncbi:MAG TPA: isoprenylcysteine carboxylmethyltransferase family protein [Myxococcota bacterium]|nr:isoprenylcysteine carboxylmethyltransferase family protein [Myxococcota bacterium]